jgi:hypothetical protein
VGCCSTRAQVRHAAPVVFPVDFNNGEHVYRVHHINVQLVTDPVIMPAKREHGCDQLKILQGTLIAIKYRDDILDPIVLPFLQQRNFDHVFQHDNARCNVATR